MSREGSALWSINSDGRGASVGYLDYHGQGARGVLRTRIARPIPEGVRSLSFVGAEDRTTLTKSADQRLLLDFFEDARFTGLVNYADSLGEGAQFVAGQLEDSPGEFAVYSEEDQVHACVQVPGRTYVVRPREGSLSEISEMDSSALPSCAVSTQLMKSMQMRALTRPQEGRGERIVRNGNALINVLVLYTRATHSAIAGGVRGDSWRAVGSYISSLIAHASYAFRRSGIRVSLNWGIVPAGGNAYVEVPYVETGDLWADLGALTRGEGHLAVAHQLRDQRQADIVMLLINETTGSYGGLANEPNRDLPPERFADHAFGVVEWRSAKSNNLFTHELGHVFGAGHHRNDGGPGLYDDSAGYRFTYGAGNYQHNYVTLMAYRQAWDDVMASYFSNPDVLFFDSSPTGDAECNNARTINATAAIVSGYR